MAKLRFSGLKCKKCGYIWRSISRRTINKVHCPVCEHFHHIPAKCPACGEKIWTTKNYEILHSESKCFIATAAYGTQFTKEIDVIRKWRNEIEKNSLGKSFIEFYYIISPPLASVISRSNLFKKTVRLSLVPLVNYLKERKIGS